MAQKKVTGAQVSVNLNDLQDVDVSSAADGEVLTRVSGQWEAAPAGGGVEMNVYRLTGGSGNFSGTIINNFTTVSQRDESPTTLWGNWDSYAGSFQCLVSGVYEIVIECHLSGSSGAPAYVWPEELTAYGVDMPYDYPASMDMPTTKSHTRYSPPGSHPNLNGNFGLSQLSAPAGESGTKVTFTERYIVRSDVGGLVYPRLFAASYNNASAGVSCSMTISFMKISDYSPT